MILICCWHDFFLRYFVFRSKFTKKKQTRKQNKNRKSKKEKPILFAKIKQIVWVRRCLEFIFENFIICLWFSFRFESFFSSNVISWFIYKNQFIFFFCWNIPDLRLYFVYDVLLCILKWRTTTKYSPHHTHTKSLKFLISICHLTPKNHTKNTFTYIYNHMLFYFPPSSALLLCIDSLICLLVTANFVIINFS